MTVTLGEPVGMRFRTQNVANKQVDQGKVIELLASIPAAEGGKKEEWAFRPLSGPDKSCPKLLADAIWDFQVFWKAKGVFHNIDGVVDPAQHTLAHMNELSELDAKGFTLPSPEGQLDATACWAASLAWMTRANSKIAAKSQLQFLGAGHVGASGAITKNELLTVSLSGVLLSRRRLPAAELLGVIQARQFPMFIGFSTGPMSGHVNVIHGYDDTKNQVAAMEPWSPDPSNNPNFSMVNNGGLMVYENNATHVPFVFAGAHVTRPASYYTSKPLDGEFVIGVFS